MGVDRAIKVESRRRQKRRTDQGYKKLTARYWGLIVSNSSKPTGTPRLVRSHKSWRAMRRPLLIW